MFFYILDNLFWIGLGFVGLTLIFSRSYLKPVNYKPENAKMVNRAYIFGFFVLIYGWGVFTMDFGFHHTWYETIGYICLAILISGAWLENRRDFPLLNREMLNALEKLKQRDEESYLNFYLAVEKDGFATAFQEHQSFFLDGHDVHSVQKQDRFQDFELSHAKQAVEFAKQKTFLEVLQSRLPETYKTIAFQYLAEEQLKVAADAILLADKIGGDIKVPLENFFVELDADSQYEIFPLISGNDKCLKFYFSGQKDLSEKVKMELIKKLGERRVKLLKTSYKENYPNSNIVPVAHLI